MIPIRKNVAIAIDGGGIRGAIVTQALAVLEDYLRQPLHHIFRLAVGTSTGSIISAGIGAGLTGRQMTRLYRQMGASIFPNTWHKWLFPLTSYRYPARPLKSALNQHFGTMKMSEFWQAPTPTDVVITSYDLLENRTRFIKPWKEEYQGWSVAQAVQSSCTVPTYFPVVEGRYIDGGVGAYSNPCYVAAYEARDCLNWDPSETTLISIGTGRSPYHFDPRKTGKLWAWDWIGKTTDVFLQSAYDQQVHLVETHFKNLDFRRFQIDLEENIPMDDTRQMDKLVAYGSALGRMIVTDQVDPIQGINLKERLGSTAR
jgi:predicted acylesterase/phospholipase RssA